MQGPHCEDLRGSCHHTSLGFSPTFRSLCLCSGRPLPQHSPSLRPRVCQGPSSRDSWCVQAVLPLLGLQLFLLALSAWQQQMTPAPQPTWGRVSWHSIPPNTHGHRLRSSLQSVSIICLVRHCPAWRGPCLLLPIVPSSHAVAVNKYLLSGIMGFMEYSLFSPWQSECTH